MAIPILPPPQVTGLSGGLSSASSAFVLWELGEGGIIFITLCTNASRANGKRQSNLLLQGISWLPAGSRRNFALPSLLGLEAARRQHRLCFAPKKTLSCSCDSPLFLLRKMTEGMVSAYGVPQGSFALAPTASWVGRAAHDFAGPRGKASGCLSSRGF